MKKRKGSPGALQEDACAAGACAALNEAQQALLDRVVSERGRPNHQSRRWRECDGDKVGKVLEECFGYVRTLRHFEKQ